MADDFQFTQAEIDAAEQQLATDLEKGIQETEIDGRRIRRSSLKERYEILQSMAADVSAEDDGGFLRPRFDAAE